MKPIIKFNGGSPIALCNRCFIMMCYVTYNEADGKDAEAKVVNSKFDYDGNLCTSAAKGSTPPIYCDKCEKLLKYSLNE